MKLKRIVAVLVLFCMVLCMLPPVQTNAATVIAKGTCGANLKWTYSSDRTLTISGTGDMKDYGRIDSLPPWYHYYREVIDHLIIEDGVTSIGKNAFYYCTSLASVEISDSVTNIGDGAFAWCFGLTSITIPESVTSLGNGAFELCHGLTSVKIPKSIASIGDGVFENCAKLTQILVDENNPNYSSDKGVLFNKNKTVLIKAPEGVSGYYAISDSVTSISDGAFANCTRLKTVTIPDSVTSMGSSAFSNCTGLTSVKIGNSVTSIGSSAFFYCTSLTSVTIPDSVTSVGGSAFSGCTDLTSVAIPASVTYIGGSAFSSCNNLSSVIYCGTKAQWDAISIAENNGVLEGPHLNVQYHDWISYTCTTPETCKFCGKTRGGLAPHNCEVWFVLLEPTCTEKGIKAGICNVCQQTVKKNVLALGHTCQSVVTAPTCTEQGYTTNTCTVCGEVTETDYVEAKGHSHEFVVTAPTCTEQGYTTKTCTVCGDVTVTDYVDATHSYKSVVTAPTCTEPGYTTNTCTVCGDVTETDYVEAKGHSYEFVVTVPTCTEQGCTTNTCTVCGDVTVTDYVDAKGHTWSDWVQIVAPTCKAEGSQMRFCNCGVREACTIEKLEHTYEAGVCTGCGGRETHNHVWDHGICTICSQNMAEAIELNGDGKITAFDAQILAETKAGLRTLTDEQWAALGDLSPKDIVDYVLGRFSTAE